MEKNYKIIKYVNGELNLDVIVSLEENTVWLTQKALTVLFDADKSRISRHIKKIIEQGKLDTSVVAENATTGSDGKTYITKYYNLDMIMTLGYKVNSKQADHFRNWANEILNELKLKKALVEPIIKFECDDISLDVTVSPKEDTVWLTQAQICQLFDTSKPNISMHINNIFSENELQEASTVKDFLTVQIEGEREITRVIKLYNLDMILAVGYRIKSHRGNIFRQWSNKILKEYLLKGYSVNDKRCLECQENIISLNNKVNNLIENATNLNNRLSSLESTETILSNMPFYENDIFEAYSYIKKLLLSAKKEIIVIDGYIDLSVLDMLNEAIVPITIYTFPSANITKQDISKFQINHNLTIIRTNVVHDRFLMIDDDIYSIGSSLKDVGKKRFVMTKIATIRKEDILKNI